MDFKKSLILSSLIVLVIVGIFCGYSIWENNRQMHKNFVMAQDAFRNANLSKAAKLLEGKPPKDIEKDFYILKYNVQINQGNLYQAEETCQILLKKYPKDAFINYLLSLIYLNTGDREKTEQYLKEANNLSPENIDYKISLANFYTQIGQYNKALELFEQLKNVLPGYEIAWASIAFIYEEQNELEKALKYRKEAAEKFNTNAYDLYMLARLYERMGQYENAAKYYGKTIEVDSNNSTDSKTKYFQLMGKPYHSLAVFKTENIPYISSNNLMIIKASVKGVEGKFLVDTGASRSVLYSNFVKKHNIKYKTNLAGIVASANGTKNIVPMANVDITIGNLLFKDNLSFIIFDDNAQFDGIIGNDILSNADYYIDRTNKIITIRR